MNDLLRKGDFWSGLALAALGTYIVMQASRWTYLGDDGPGPGFFPLWYGGAMIGLSLLLVAGAARRPGSRSLQIAELRRALLAWSAFAAAIALLKLVGFMLAFGLLTWFIVARMFGQPPRTALALAFGSAIAFQVLFGVLLEVPLPTGLLPSVLAR